MKKIEHKPINWVNGLKLTSEHFFTQYHCHTENVQRALGFMLTAFNYGLGEPIDGMGESVELEITGESVSSLSLRLKCCNAITRSGIPIIYYEGLYGDQGPMVTISSTQYQDAESEFVVFISVDPGKLIPVGAPDPEESPLHHPNVLPAIGLHAVSKSQVNKTFYRDKFVPVAEVKFAGDHLVINQQYIPPVQRSGYHDGITTFISQLSRMLRNIKSDIRQIYFRNISDRRREELANNTLVLCEAFSRYFDNSIFWVEEMSIEEPPVKLIQSVNGLANLLNSSLQTMTEAERERLLQYYNDWTDITPSEFLSTMENILSIRYDHTDIANALHLAGGFISLLNTMFHKMSELEYIGMIRENIVVGDESNYHNEPAKKKVWSFMR